MPISKFADAMESRRLIRQRVQSPHVILTGRGAAAIYATLRALDLHNRAVLIPANACYIVLWAVLESGNQPFLVDVDPLTGNLSPETLDRCAVTQPAVLIPAHMYGIPAPMAAICTWARKKDVFVIEDAALALGAEADGQPTGSWGDVGILSFGAGKIVDVGEGGALLCSDERLAAEIERVLNGTPLWTERLSQLNHEWLEIYWALHQFEAENPRLRELYPALFNIYGEIVPCRMPNSHWHNLPAALKSLDANLAHRAELRWMYDERLTAVPIRTLKGAALWKYPLLVAREHRDPLLHMLWEEHIFDATRWYPSLQALRGALTPELPDTFTPAADQLADEIINLPLETDPATAEKIIETVLGYFDAL
jgi:dTDP-4-amino-4,6-dideoxygalactose transaminase